jgi:hypothetical protein
MCFKLLSGFAKGQFMKKLCEDLRKFLGNLDPAIWVALIGISTSLVGGGVKYWTENRGLSDIDQGRRKRIEGLWDGNGYQEFTKEEVPKLKDLNMTDYTKLPNGGAAIDYPAHLDLQVQGKKIFGELEITAKIGKRHVEKKFKLLGSLADRDYIRLDYKTGETGTIEFGTILVELDPPGKKLKGMFVSFGPITRTIVGGRYEFDRGNGN